METPSIITGNCFVDDRGKLLYNNSFNANSVKRIYVIENKDTTFIRAWRGHRIEQRWFTAITGNFEVKLIAVDNWDNPSKTLQPLTFDLSPEKMDILHIPGGYLSNIQAKTDGAKLLVMANYMLGEVKDEYRFDANYFNQ